MPAKKQVSKKVTHEQVVEPVQEDMKKSVKKPGRTLLVKTSGDVSHFDTLVGLVGKSETKSTSSHFLTFDTVENAVNAYRKLKSDSQYKVKYSYYRVFFKMSGLEDSTDYNDVKKQLSEFVSSNTLSNVLYCKFYRKNNKYLGCGDFTLDTLSGMSKLLSKEGGLKDYSFDKYSGTFYRYNNKQVSSHDE